MMFVPLQCKTINNIQSKEIITDNPNKLNR